MESGPVAQSLFTDSRQPIPDPRQPIPDSRKKMLITQTPLRISIAGGGCDLPDYYSQHGGYVVSTAIDKFIYVIVKARYDDKIYVDYSKKEIVDAPT